VDTGMALDLTNRLKNYAMDFVRERVSVRGRNAEFFVD
jgi:hypothetical protein